MTGPVINVATRLQDLQDPSFSYHRLQSEKCYLRQVILQSFMTLFWWIFPGQTTAAGRHPLPHCQSVDLGHPKLIFMGEANPFLAEKGETM